MTALAALLLGVVAIGYAVWPAFRGASAAEPAELAGRGVSRAGEGLAAEVRALRGWSLAAGEFSEKRDAPATQAGGA